MSRETEAKRYWLPMLLLHFGPLLALVGGLLWWISSSKIESIKWDVKRETEIFYRNRHFPKKVHPERPLREKMQELERHRFLGKRVFWAGGLVFAVGTTMLVLTKPENEILKAKAGFDEPQNPVVD